MSIKKTMNRYYQEKVDMENPPQLKGLAISRKRNIPRKLNRFDIAFNICAAAAGLILVVSTLLFPGRLSGEITSLSYEYRVNEKIENHFSLFMTRVNEAKVFNKGEIK